MRKVLILTYYWPPSGGAGVQRWLKFTKYLREFGWEPIIYTAENAEYPAIDNSLEKDIPEGVQVLKQAVWEPYAYYKKLIGVNKEEKINAGFLAEKKRPGMAEKFAIWLRGNFFIPDARKFWIKPSIRYLIQYLNHNSVDAIVSTGPPHTMHMIALGLKQKTGLPWLADFRDPWTNIDFYHELMLSGIADRKHHRMELSVLKSADEVVVISKSMKTDFEQLFVRDYTVITNGYDMDDVPSSTIQTDEKFSVAHIGTMVKTRNPVNLWNALSTLVSENKEFADALEIKLAGSVDHTVSESIESAGLSKYVNKISYLPHNEVSKLQQQARVLLLLINDTPNARVILPGKFFEYMAARRPILCIGPMDGDAAEIISETHSGMVVDKDDKEGIKQALQQLFTNFRNNENAVNSKGIEKFSRRELTSAMAKRLNTLVGN